jgi:hypothetical protein
MPTLVRPMLATLGELPPPSEDAQFGYEMKWDGVRAVRQLRPGQGPVPQRPRDHREISGAARSRRRVARAPRCPGRRDCRVLASTNHPPRSSANPDAAAPDHGGCADPSRAPFASLEPPPRSRAVNRRPGLRCCRRQPPVAPRPRAPKGHPETSDSLPRQYIRTRAAGAHLGNTPGFPWVDVAGGLALVGEALAAVGQRSHPSLRQVDARRTHSPN